MNISWTNSRFDKFAINVSIYLTQSIWIRILLFNPFSVTDKLTLIFVAPVPLLSKNQAVCMQCKYKSHPA